MAQRSVSGFKSVKDTDFADNTTGNITALKTRDILGDVADSFLNKTDEAYTSFVATAAGTNTYTATLSPVITAYASTQRYFVLFTNANTGASTLNFNALGAKSIVKNGSAALASGDIAAGQICQLHYDGTNLQIVGKVSPGDTSANDTDVKHFEQFDWIFTYSGALATGQELPLGWVTFFAGAGLQMNTSSVGVNTTENVTGAIEITTGTTATGYSLLAKHETLMIVGLSTLKLRYRIAISAALSDATDTYTCYVGFGNTVNGTEPTQGMYFRYTHSVNTARWEAVTANGGVRTATNTTVLADLLYSIFSIEVNAAGTSVEFKINGSVVATNTTNIPVGAFGFVTIITKSVGTAERKLITDWYDFLLTRTTAR